MFLFCSNPTGHSPLDSNVPSSAAIRPETRDLERLDELIELGLMLARDASRQALAQDEAGSAQAAQGRPRKSPGRASNQRPLFNQLCDAVRDTVSLKSRLEPALLPTARAARDTGTDKRRPLIATYLHDAAKSIRDRTERAAILREAETRITSELEADPGQTLPGAAIIMAICDTLNLPYDLAHMPDALLHAGFSHTPQDGLLRSPSPHPHHERKQEVLF